MEFKQIIVDIESSQEFKDFTKKNPHYYLVHVFTVKDPEMDSVWQIGYYSRETDKIVVFESNNGLIMIHPPAEALKKDEYIKKLDLDKLKVSNDEATKICEHALKEHYPKEVYSKAICLLQNLPEFGNVWNITMVTLAISVINIKIDAITGRVVKHEKQDLMNWKS